MIGEEYLVDTFTDLPQGLGHQGNQEVLTLTIQAIYSEQGILNFKNIS